VFRSLRLWAIAALTFVMSHTIALCGSHGEFVGNNRTVKTSDDGMSAEVIDGLQYKEEGGRSWRIPSGAIVESRCFSTVLLALIGQPFEGLIKNASLLYNYFCLNQTRARDDVNGMFREAMLASGIQEGEVNVLYNAVVRFGPNWNVRGIDPACLRPDGRPDFARCTQDSGAEKKAILIWPPAGPEELRKFEKEFTASAPPKEREAMRKLASSSLPQFPWPPPTASASYVLPDKLFNSRPSMGDVTGEIISTLEHNGYVERSFFQTPAEGVALVTRLERINNDGSSAAEDKRWPTTQNSASNFDLLKFLQGLFFVDAGHYRVIVFILQDLPFSQSSQKPTGEQALGWLRSGVNVLPPEIAERPFKGGHCTVLIYEFASDGTAVRLIESHLTGKEHLEKAGLLSLLEKVN
jgi:Protein of unknown function (DUF1353)